MGVLEVSTKEGCVLSLFMLKVKIVNVRFWHRMKWLETAHIHFRRNKVKAQKKMYTSSMYTQS